MKKIVIIFLGLVIVVAEIIVIALSFSRDKVGPNIVIDQSNIRYSYGCDNSQLLKGAAADDEIDGDVSDSIVVSKRVKIVEDVLEVVTYTASDNSGNITSMEVIFVTEENGTCRLLPYDSYSVNIDTLEFTIEGSNVTGYIDNQIVVNRDEKIDEE